MAQHYPTDPELARWREMLPEKDYSLVSEAYFRSFSEPSVDPAKAETPGGAEAIRGINRYRWHMEEAMCGCV